MGAHGAQQRAERSACGRCRPHLVSEVLEGAPRALTGAVGRDAATAAARRLAVCLYALHLLTVWAIAVSNILLGASLAVTLWATWRRHLSWRPLLPLVPP